MQTISELLKEQKLEKGDVSPYSGVLVPPDFYRYYHVEMDKNGVLTEQLEKCSTKIEPKVSSADTVDFFLYGLITGAVVGLGSAFLVKKP